MRFQQPRGNGLVEYALPLGATVLIAIAGITVLQETLRNNIVQSHQDAGTVTQGGQLNLQRMGQHPNLQRIGIALPDGQWIYVDGVPKSLAQGVETLGTNGTTESLAQALRSLAEQLAEAGEISPTEAELVKKLANHGHQIAELERLVEQALQASGGNMQLLRTMTFPFDGRQIHAGEAALLLGEAEASNPNVPPFLQLGFLERVTDPQLLAINGDNPFMGATRHEFLETFREVQQSSGLQNEGVQSLISQLTLSIDRLSRDFASYTYDVTKGDLPPDQLQEMLISSLSDAKSIGICHSSGQHNDTGQQCQ
jgi:hypothetical protein